MNIETKIKYSYMILVEYEELIDGTSNFHHNSTIKVSQEEGTVAELLEVLQRNSNVKGHSITKINFEILE